MHLRALLPLLLAASASALPGDNVVRDETPVPSPEPTDEPPVTTTEADPTTTNSEPEPTETDLPDLPPEEKCELPFNAGDLGVVQDTWEKSGAGTFLRDFLSENGVDDWVGNLFQHTVGGGSQGGSTYDCTNFPAEGSCNSPGHQLCLDYTPPEMFYVHLSIANLYSAFVTIHEDMQDSMITNLASEIKKVVDIFGPPPAEDSFILTLLIGAFVGAAAFAGPAWMIGAPMTGVAGGLNIASGIQASQEGPTPQDWENELESTLGGIYKGFSDTLESTIKAIFSGNFDGLEGFDSDPVDWIVDQFDGGKMLDYKLVNPAIDAWSDAVRKMIVQGLVIQSMKEEEHYVWQDYSKTEEECGGKNHAIWMHDMCTVIAKESSTAISGRHPNPISDDIYDPLVGDYGFDFQEVMQNAIDCAANGGGDADLTGIPPFDEVPKLPACFCNFEVKLMDFYHRPPG